MAEIPSQLIAAGYKRVERFTAHFPRNESGNHVREQSVKDPRVIKLCDRNGWLLVTTDSDMRLTHVEEIKKCRNLAILATAHNRVSNPLEWVKALIDGRAGIERRFRKMATPWFGQIDRKGNITTCYTINEKHGTRRNRPSETREATMPAPME